MESTTGRCPHCGKELKPLVLPALFGAKEHIVGYEPCDCPEAVEEREQERRREDEEKREKERRAFYSKLEKSGVPKRYLHAKHLMAGELTEKVEGGSSLYVWGENGTFKTTLASAIMRRLVHHGRRAEMVNAVDLLVEVQSTYGTPKEESAVLAHYSKCPVLVLDDLGKEQQTAWTVSRLYAIINARYANMLPTVITSNFKVSELAARMGACDESTARAIASRIAGSCETVAMAGGDRRLGNG